jgi:hypothetical protein
MHRFDLLRAEEIHLHSAFVKSCFPSAPLAVGGLKNWRRLPVSARDGNKFPVAIIEGFQACMLRELLETAHTMVGNRHRLRALSILKKPSEKPDSRAGLTSLLLEASILFKDQPRRIQDDDSRLLYFKQLSRALGLACSRRS